MHTKLVIEYAKPQDLADCLTLEYKLRDNPIVAKWIKKLQQAQQTYSIDDPARFYGFDVNTETDALVRINQCIDIINEYNPVISRHLSDINDQDHLNYLHHIFEVYHGLLDQQTSEFFKNAPAEVRKALADLNICVHRCETVSRLNFPRHVVTYFGLPKDSKLDIQDYQFAETTWPVGTVFLNYVEIGKTLLDLAIDNDQYIADEAFQPFCRYSADFVVRFYEQTAVMAQQQADLVNAYYDKHRDKLGPWHPSFTIGNFPLADLVSPVPIAQLTDRPYVKSVQII
ncbi:MAG: hypothetical protein EBU08_07850 [Micrococcales bacterium]|nr:hypothetical protein [Micrococcales bacterium]